MRVVVGPVLHFRGQDGGRWRLAALVVGEGQGEPEALRIGDGATVAPELLAVRRGHAFWRYEFSLPLADGESVGRYAIGGRQGWEVRLPAREGGRRLAYTACNGNDDGVGGGLPREELNALWRGLGRRTGAAVPPAAPGRRPALRGHAVARGAGARGWRRLPWREGNAAPFTAGMADGAEDYYLRRYAKVWSQPEVARPWPPCRR
jgi:hypothetical protein